MKILCIGHNGQVARSLCERAKRGGLHLVARGRPGLDLMKVDSVRAAIEKDNPDLIINAAAYTRVDQAEAETEKARALNHQAAGVLARLTDEAGIPLIHFSTDYVFDGKKEYPYVESDTALPTSVYGKSKYDGELAVASATQQHIILRTAWVYSPFGTNFVKTMLRLAQDQSEVRVVDDQIGNPTSALDIADIVLQLSAKLADCPGNWGVYHLAGTGTASWADVAVETFRLSQSFGGPTAKVKRVPTSEYPTLVRRPGNSRLNTSKLFSAFGFQLPHWQSSLAVVVQRLLRQD